MNDTNTTSGNTWTTTSALPPPSSGRVFWHPTEEESGRCCVKGLMYPASWGEYTNCGEISCQVGFYFHAIAEYSDEEPCNCGCCEFRQSVRLKHFVGDEKVESQGDQLHADVTGFDAKGTGFSLIPMSLGGSLQSQPAGIVSTEAYGRRGQPPRPWDLYWNECLYSMFDRPSEHVYVGQDYDIFYEFEGAIHDTCQGGMKVASERFILARSGRVLWGTADSDWARQQSTRDSVADRAGGPDGINTPIPR